MILMLHFLIKIMILIGLKLDKNSKIKLTGDSYVTSFGFDGGVSNIDLNGYKLYVNGKVYSK